MSLSIGIVGLPNVGKSSLFKLLTKNNILVANYPFATIEPNVGIIDVLDQRIDQIAEIIKPKKITYPTIKFIDIAGLVKGASRGDGLGNKFLSHIRETDAICEVIRCFELDEISHLEGAVDPVRDAEIIQTELILSDLERLEKRLEKVSKIAESTKEREAIFEYNVLKKIKEGLNNNKPVRKLNLTEEEIQIIKPYNLITLKPIIYFGNVSQQDLLKETTAMKSLREYAQKNETEVVFISSKVEDDKENYQLNNDKINQFIKVAYSTLSLETFFTAGETEVRGWTYKKGNKAPQCAGLIHTDMERGFIRVEVIKLTDFLTYRSQKAVKEQGKLKSEGKEYIMQDGDICLFRFNV